MRVAAVDWDGEELDCGGLPLEEDALWVELVPGEAMEDDTVDEEEDEGENDDMWSEGDAEDEDEDEDGGDVDVEMTLEVNEVDDDEM